MDEINSGFFNFNQWDNKHPRRKKFNVQFINEQYKEYVLVENELEDMIRDNVIDISVDTNGIFYYHLSETSLTLLDRFAKDIKSIPFSGILFSRGLDIDKYNRYKNIMRRLTP